MSAVDRLAEIEARANAATEGPWRGLRSCVVAPADAPEAPWADVANVKAYGGALIGESIQRHQDRDFIAHAREDVPALVAAGRALLALAEWHETKAEKARRFPGEGREAEMAKAAELHDDAARRIREVLNNHLGGAS